MWQSQDSLLLTYGSSRWSFFSMQLLLCHARWSIDPHEAPRCMCFPWVQYSLSFSHMHSTATYKSMMGSMATVYTCLLLFCLPTFATQNCPHSRAKVNVTIILANMSFQFQRVLQIIAWGLLKHSPFSLKSPVHAAWYGQAAPSNFFVCNNSTPGPIIESQVTYFAIRKVALRFSEVRWSYFSSFPLTPWF